MSTPLRAMPRQDYRSVSQRLSERCAEIEHAINQLLHNEQVTIARVSALVVAPPPMTFRRRLRWLVIGR